MVSEVGNNDFAGEHDPTSQKSAALFCLSASKRRLPGEFSVSLVRLPEDVSHFFRLYSRPLDYTALDYFARRGSPVCKRIKKVLRLGIVVIKQNVVKCLQREFLQVLLRVSLESIDELSDREKVKTSVLISAEKD